jgi:hypothetical protein
MKMLIDAGANVHSKDTHRVSVASHLLIYNQERPETKPRNIRQSLRLLLDAGVDPAECSPDGTTLLMRAVSFHWSSSHERREINDRAVCMYIVDLVDTMMARIEAGKAGNGADAKPLSGSR